MIKVRRAHCGRRFTAHYRTAQYHSVNCRMAAHRKRKRNANGYAKSESNEWFTPPEILARVRAVLGTIDLDPASCAAAQERVRARRYFSREDDGLTKSWAGRVWLNPPYERNRVNAFVDKLVHEVESGSVTRAILLLHLSSSSTRWFHNALAASAAHCLLRLRLHHTRPDGGGGSYAPWPSILMYFGDNVAGFQREFGGLGAICYHRNEGRSRAEAGGA
jgi:ParB family transcriptional regulator, chromosome partitioning protein